MGKSLPSSTGIQQFARFISSNRLHQVKPTSRITPETAKSKGFAADSSEQRLKIKKIMEVESSNSNSNSKSSAEHRRLPLADVVAECVKRWFQDNLKEAKAGDTSMQVLVGQMYYNGYGVPKDPQKGKAWISRASKSRSSAWKVSNKRPGYNASDSDSEDSAGDIK